MAAPKLEKSGKRILGNNLLSNCKTRQKQMKYLMDNMREPDFALIDCNAHIADEFNLDDNETLNTAGITWRILNSQGFGNGAHSSNAFPSWGSVANFMASIQDYLKENPISVDLSDYAKKVDIPSTAGLATEEYVNNKVQGLASTDYVD